MRTKPYGLIWAIMFRVYRIAARVFLLFARNFHNCCNLYELYPGAVPLGHENAYIVVEVLPAWFALAIVSGGPFEYRTAIERPLFHLGTVVEIKVNARSGKTDFPYNFTRYYCGNHRHRRLRADFRDGICALLRFSNCINELYCHFQRICNIDIAQMKC